MARWEVALPVVALLVVAALVPGARGMVMPAVATGGSCKPYPADGLCGEVGLAGRSVFVYDGDSARSDFATRDQEMGEFYKPLETAASDLAGYVCHAYAVWWRGGVSAD
jgi:hypothetical protein